MQVDELKFPVSRSNLRFLLVYRKSNWPFVLCGIIFSSCHMNPTAVISLNATRGHHMRLNLLRGLITLIWNLKIIKVLFSPWFLNVKSLVSKMMQFCGRKSVVFPVEPVVTVRFFICRFEPQDMEVQLSDELAGSLRQLKVLHSFVYPRWPLTSAREDPLVFSCNEFLVI